MEETSLRVGDVIRLWSGSSVTRTVVKLEAYRGPLHGCAGVATVTAFTRSGTTQFSLWQGQTVWRLAS